MEKAEPTIRSPELRKSLDDLAEAGQRYVDVLCHNQRKIHDFLNGVSNNLLYSGLVASAYTMLVYFTR